MGLSVFTPPQATPQGWIDVSNTLSIRYGDTLLGTVTSKFSRYTYLTPKTILWKAGFVQPAGVSGSYILGADLPLPAAALPSAPGVTNSGFQLGPATMVRPGAWYAQGTVTLINGALYGNGQRAVFYADTGFANLWGVTGSRPDSFLPNDTYWWSAEYEIA